MRYMGIDYGKKRIGTAVSDETGKFALPHSVVPNDAGLILSLKKIIEEMKVGEVVLGESKNYKGEDNPIMAAVRNFKAKLEAETGLPVHFEAEYMTSLEANRMNVREPEQSRRSGVRNRRPTVDNAMLDASAAALILQSFLDKEDYGKQ